MELYSAGWTLKYFSDHYRCTLREGESGTMLSFYPRPEGGFYQIESRQGGLAPSRSHPSRTRMLHASV